MTLRRGQMIVILVSIWILAVVLPAAQFTPHNADEGKPGSIRPHGILPQLIQNLEDLKEKLAKEMPAFGEHTLLLELFAIFWAVTLAVFLGIFLFMLRKLLRRRKRKDDFQLYYENSRATWPVFIFVLLVFLSIGGLIWLMHQTTSISERLAPPQKSTQTSKRSSPSESPTVSSAKPVTYPRLAPGWIKYPLALLLGGLLAWAASRLLMKGPTRGEAPPEFKVVQIAADAAAELEKGGEVTDVVLRCYRDMSRLLSFKVSLSRDMTAREFAERLKEVGVHGTEIEGLTGLFERVRYGSHIAGPDERREAISLLESIQERYGKSSHES